MAAYLMHLNAEPFEKIKAGTKYVEMRLYDDKRRQFKVGDKIDFLLAGDDAQKVECIIDNLLVYDNFDELYKDYDKVDLGYDEDQEALPSDMEKFYPKEQQEKWGVLAIELELV